MNTHADKSQANKSQSVANENTQKQNGDEAALQFADSRPVALQMQRIQELANNSPQVKQLQSYQAMANSHASKTATAANAPVRQKKNETGLPDQVKSGIETLSGYSMDDVKVHYNSGKPAQLNAHAYAQGADIHIAPGQDKHLPHEAWHVVQQKQGRVQPTVQMKGEIHINDDTGLEKEADEMGARAVQIQQDADTGSNIKNKPAQNDQPVTQAKSKPVIQRVLRVQGTPQTVAQVVTHFAATATPITATQQTILTTWANAATIHNFRQSKGITGWNKIPIALNRAENPPPPAFFCQANFEFITDTGGARLPTLYFSGGGQTGRLRQQHKSGPLAEMDPNPQTRASFASKADRDIFVAAIKLSARNNTAFVDPGNSHTPPVNGEHMLEYSLDPATGVARASHHPSDGLKQPKPAAIDSDVAITGIYNNIIGTENDDDCCCCCCFITTACTVSKGLPDDCEELQALRDYRDNYLLHREYGRELFKFYYSYSPAIVDGINAQPDAKQIYDGLYKVIRECVHCIRRRELEEAFLIYIKMVLMLRDKYAPQTIIPDYLQTILQESLL